MTEMLSRSYLHLETRWLPSKRSVPSEKPLSNPGDPSYLLCHMASSAQPLVPGTSPIFHTKGYKIVASFSSIMITVIDWITSVPVVIRISARVSYWKWQSEQITLMLTLAMGPRCCLQNQIHIFFHSLKGLNPELLLFAWSHLQLYSPYPTSLKYWSVSSL